MMKPNTEIVVALLLGGTSPEKEVSKDSSKSIYDALVKLGYKVKLVNPGYGINQPKNLEAFFSSEEYTDLSNDNYIKTIDSNIFDGVDVAFIGLHGKWGEDGTIQSLLELKGIPYTGSNILGSAVGIDKAKSKAIMRSIGVPTPEWLLVEKNNLDISFIQNEIKSRIKLPFIVKPNDQGSTIGLSVCNLLNDIEPAIEEAFNVSDSIIIEGFVKGRELTVGVVGNLALPVLEITPKHELYDYECKYTDGMSEYTVPAKVPEAIALELQKYTMDIFKAVGCHNYGRVDFLFTENNEPFCLEINSLPGMTSHSLVPKMAKSIGISFENLVDRIVKYALGYRIGE